jgi:uncharacterized protein (TIGR03435 family)
MKHTLLLVCLAGLIAAQEFEVATIKPSAPHSGGPLRAGLQMAPGGRLIATNFTLKMLIEQAYQVKDFQISGGPAWLGTERFDINAKGAGDGPIGPNSLRPFLASLLKERFHLEFHRERKEAAVYHLVQAKGGTKLKAVDAPAGPGPQRQQVRLGRGLLEAQQAPLSLLVTQLAGAVGRNVIDKTELKGLYNIKLEFTPEPGLAGPGGGGGPQHAGDSPAAPSVFTAVQEQLGLKLEPAKGPVDILIIDRAEKPTEN